MLRGQDQSGGVGWTHRGWNQKWILVHRLGDRRKNSRVKSLLFLLRTSMKEIMMLDLLSLTQLSMRNKARRPASLLFTSHTAEGMCHSEHLMRCQAQRHLEQGPRPWGSELHRHVSPEILKSHRTFGSHSSPCLPAS